MTHDPKTNEEKARKIVKWITAQRNGQGGFYSTQVGGGLVGLMYCSLCVCVWSREYNDSRVTSLSKESLLVQARLLLNTADVAAAQKLGTAFLPGLHNGHGHEWLCQYSVDITTIRFTEVLVDTPPSSTSPTPPISVSTSPQSPTPESSTTAMEVASKTPTHNVGCGEWTSFPLLFTSVG
ncbi:hypothetical protein Pmani_017413 [Petrolisthes manimaculis]|uniref:Alpha-macroglobulin-like TED domain-containing protein n=1 Tax=Petrolisthes manimaculis TaxID=1843537 RepID=A0AAE1PPK3_9EUCA|nr:hypothetical protein Pmani_017413 [Petrolisthes manimaculis]